MSGEQQLERSVLEAKGRDELHAIAVAMSLDPTPRARKPTLIDQILRAAGVEVSRPPTRRRSRANGAELPLSSAGEGPGDGDGPSPIVAEPGRRAAAASPSTSVPTTDTGGASRTEPAPDGVEGPAGSEPGTTARPVVSAGRRSPRALAADTAPAETTDGGVLVQPRHARPPATTRSAGRRVPAARRAEAPSGSTGEVAREADDETSGRLPAEATRPPADTEDERAGRAGPGRGLDERGGGTRMNGTAPEPAAGEETAESQEAGRPGGSVTLLAPRPGRSGGDVGDVGSRRRRRRGRGVERTVEREGGSFEPAPTTEPTEVRGLLDLREEGFGFVRVAGYLPSPRDVYVPLKEARRLGLRRGDVIEGLSRPPGPSEKYPALVRVDRVSGRPAEEIRQRPRFEDLTPLFPDTRLRLEVPGDSANMTARIVDLLAPIGKGQRGLIVSPPKAGKTTVMKQIAHSIEKNNPDVHLMVLLVDERPEEVTDMRRSVQGEVVASTFDRPAEEHTQVAELAIERAKRLVEQGRDVVIILDGITRLARAYNLAQPATGRIMSGGVDSGALYPPKRFFGAARNIEEGGSLTILATALVETGSRMDEVIFEEFKGTGNMELRLDRRLAERRIYPAIDVNGSSTRHEELLFDRHQLAQVWKLRRVLNALASEGSGAAGLELLIDKIKSTRTNDEFLAEVAKGPGV